MNNIFFVFLWGWEEFFILFKKGGIIMIIEYNEINMFIKYELSNVEVGKYKWWLEKEFFKVEGNMDKKFYSIVILLLNVIGKLYLGYVWDIIL